MKYGCLTRAAALPLVVAVGEHQAAATLVGVAERRLLAERLARALIMRAPIDCSFAQDGTSPQYSIASSRGPPSRSRTAAMYCVGAML